VLGAAFGTGWLACTSPTLAGIIALASSTEWNGHALRGLGLVVLYCAGLGIPFVLLAIGLGWAGTALGFLRRHARGIQLGGATVLVIIGLLMLTGAWGAVLSPLRGAVLILCRPTPPSRAPGAPPPASAAPSGGTSRRC